MYCLSEPGTALGSLPSVALSSGWGKNELVNGAVINGTGNGINRDSFCAERICD